MKVKKIVVGELLENCYIIENNDSCIIVDPGDEVDKIVSNISKRVVGILLTHNHFDHVGALEELKNKYDVKVNEMFDGFNYQIIDMPGHTSDSKVFYFNDDNIMFTGDFVFKGSIGRTDLGGSNKDMLNSLNNIIKYDGNIKLYPGHGDSTILKDELDMINYYINVLKD